MAQPEARAGVTGLWAAGCSPGGREVGVAAEPKAQVGARPGHAHHALPTHQHSDPHSEYRRPTSGGQDRAPGRGGCGRTSAPPSQAAPAGAGPGKCPGHAPSGHWGGRLGIRLCPDPWTQSSGGPRAPSTAEARCVRPGDPPSPALAAPVLPGAGGPSRRQGRRKPWPRTWGTHCGGWEEWNNPRERGLEKKSTC